jgi:cytochrome c oxidase subunit IV
VLPGARLARWAMIIVAMVVVIGLVVTAFAAPLVY